VQRASNKIKSSYSERKYRTTPGGDILFSLRNICLLIVIPVCNPLIQLSEKNKKSITLLEGKDKRFKKKETERERERARESV